MLWGEYWYFILNRFSKVSGISKLKSNYLLILINGFAGLILVDNMHFQYNTLLYGILILSISCVIEDKFIMGAIIYTILLNMKHIFIYLVCLIFQYKIK